MDEGFRPRARDKQRALAHFDLAGGDYDRVVTRGPLRLLRRRERRAVLAYAGLADPAVETVLDVGCGSGFYARAAKRQRKWVHAVDLAPRMVASVRQVVDRAEVGDVERLAPGRTYDVVICAGVLDFVTDPGRALDNLCRLVAPRGRLVLQVPRAGWPVFWYRAEKRLVGVRVNAFHREWLEERAARCGLRLAGCCVPVPFTLVLCFRREGDREAGRARPDGRGAP